MGPELLHVGIQYRWRMKTLGMDPSIAVGIELDLGYSCPSRTAEAAEPNSTQTLAYEDLVRQR
jgi:hypothetical protein